MGIITKGMGAILKAKMKAKTDKGITGLDFQRKRSRKVSDAIKAGRVPVKRKTVDKFGREKINIDYMRGPFEDYSYKPRMPRKRGQGKLFGEKFKKPKKQTKQLEFDFKYKRKQTVNPEKRLKRAIKKSEVK